jgi:hypothetical protein
MDYFATYNHPSASGLAPFTPLTEDHPKPHLSQTQMNGNVDSTSFDRKWNPVSQRVGPSAHNSGNLPETVAHTINHRKIFKFPFTLAPSNPLLGSKKPKLDQRLINFELHPKIENDSGVIENDNISYQPPWRFSSNSRHMIPSPAFSEAGEMIEKIALPEKRQNIPIKRDSNDFIDTPKSNPHLSQTQMNGHVDSTSFDRKWDPISQSVGPNAHNSRNLPETVAHAINRRKIFNFPFTLAPSNPLLGSKKPKLDHTSNTFELHPKIKNNPGVLDYDNISYQPRWQFSNKISHVIPSLALSEAGEMIEKIVLPEIHQNIPMKRDSNDFIYTPNSHPYSEYKGQTPSTDFLPFSKLEFDKNIFEGSGLPFSDDHVSKLERMNQFLENFPGEILFIPPSEEDKYVTYMNEFVNKGNTGKWSQEKNLRRRAFWMKSAAEISRLGDLWLEFWEKRSGIDLKIDFQREKMDVFRDTRQLYVLFLFFVDMINTTTETNRDPKMEQNLFQLAKKHFEEFRHISIGDQKLRVKMRELDNAAKLTKKRLQNPKLREVLWYYLTYWMEKGGRVSSTIRNLGVLKSFYNDVFVYSIRNFNKRLLQSSKSISEA